MGKRVAEESGFDAGQHPAMQQFGQDDSVGHNLPPRSPADKTADAAAITTRLSAGREARKESKRAAHARAASNESRGNLEYLEWSV